MNKCFPIVIIIIIITTILLIIKTTNLFNKQDIYNNNKLRRRDYLDEKEINSNWIINENRKSMTIEELDNSGYTWTTKNPEEEPITFPINSNKNWTKPYDILVVYVDCWHSYHAHPEWHPEKSNFPLYKLDCDLNTNWKGIREGGMMIDFFMKYYDKPLAKKYIFIHAHDTSWHYLTDIWDRLDYIVTTDYYKNNDFGSIFCMYNYFGLDENDKLNMIGVKPVDDYLKKFGIPFTIETQIKEKHMSPCCSTFFITPEVIQYQKYDFWRILKIHLVDYVIMKTNNNPEDDEAFNHNRWAAIWLESMWHQLFNRKRVQYPPRCEQPLKHEEARDLLNPEL